MSSFLMFCFILCKRNEKTLRVHGICGTVVLWLKTQISRLTANLLTANCKISYLLERDVKLGIST